MSSQSPDIRVPERDLIVAAQLGDRAAFKAIYETHQERVHNIIYYLLNDSYLVEDVVQTVFLKIIRGLPGFRFEAKHDRCCMAGSGNQFQADHCLINWRIRDEAPDA